MPLTEGTHMPMSGCPTNGGNSRVPCSVRDVRGVEDERTWKGRSVRFEEYVAEYQGALLRFATVLSGDGYTAEDLVQVALTRALKRWRDIDALDRPHAYVRKIVVNEYLSTRRRIRETPVDDLSDLLPARADHAVEHANRLALLAAVSTLPRQQRAALVLRYYEDLADDAIADVLGCSASTVRSNLTRARQTLRRRLQAGQTESASSETT